MSLDTTIPNWLSSRHIKVLPEWTQACLEWIHNEYQEQVLPSDKLKEMVYEQWLESDLAEIATPSLPEGLAQQEKTTIQGSYNLQINSIQDVGSSSYSQLIKIKGKENENVEVSATQATQSRFEPKTNRLLMMEVTDGHQKLQAMEYQTIPALNPDTPPGTKIIIQGHITCRLGVLTLTSRDVKVLGGEVDALIEENKQEKLLARLLGTSLDDHPQQSVRREPTNERAATQPFNQGVSQPEPRNNNNSTSVINERNNHRADNQWQSNNQISNQGFTNNNQQSTGNQGQPSNTRKVSNNAVQSNRFQQSINNQNRQSNSSQIKYGSVNNPSHEMEFEDGSDDLNGIDEDILREFEEAQYQEMSKKQVDERKPKPPPEWPSDEDTDEEMLAAMIDKLEEQIKAREKKPKKIENKFRGSTGPRSEPKIISKVNKVKPSSSNIAVKANSNSTQKQTSMNSFLKLRQSKVDTTKQGSDMPVSNHGDIDSISKMSLKQISNSTSRFIKAKERPPTEERILPFAEKKSSHNEEIDAEPLEIKPVPGVVIKEEITCHQTTTEPTMVPERTAMRPFSSASSYHLKVAIATRITKVENSEMAAKRRRLSSGKDSTQEASFRYLAEMMDSSEDPQGPLTFDIRGFIMTLLSALGKSNDSWSLQVRLNDGSASLDAVLSNEVLQSLIGYSVTEMKTMRGSAKNDEEKEAVEIKQKKALERCRKRLISLCEIMTVRITPGEMPLVIAMRKVEQRDCQQMKRCLPP